MLIESDIKTKECISEISEKSLKTFMVFFWKKSCKKKMEKYILGFLYNILNFLMN